MFDDLRRYVEYEVEPVAEATDSFLRKLRGAKTRVSNAIKKAEDSGKVLVDERRYVASIKPELKSTILNTAKDSLYSEFLDAIVTNNEFDEDIYRQPLVNAIENNSTYRIRFTGTGFRTIASIDIDLNATAGTLDMWGNAIKRARSSLGVQIPSKYSRKEHREYIAQRASQAWAAIAARRHSDESFTWYNTIQLRISSTAKKAPYWQIIDKGTVPLTSDRGGYATKLNRPTNFVATAEETARYEASKIMDRAKELYDSKIAEYNESLEDARWLQQKLDNMVDDIKLDIRVINNLKSELDSIGREVDKDKLRLAIEDVKKSLSSRKFFELGVRGSRRRISRRTLEEFVYG
jgi:hypothetical protein